jgi:hypothetical protein
MNLRQTVGVVAVAGALVVVGMTSWPMLERVTAQEASPIAGRTETMILVEHSSGATNIIRDEAGPAAGDMRVWGPHPLFDETNQSDTGATTQGTCIALNADFACLVNETIAFPDGSTLEIQGIQEPGAEQSRRTIVGGSGIYLGTAGTITVEPTGDLTRWKKTLEIVWLAG